MTKGKLSFVIASNLNAKLEDLNYVSVGPSILHNKYRNKYPIKN